MLVKNWMSKNVVTVEADDSMQEALSCMKEKKISLLPVLKAGELVGILTDGDLKRASASDATTLDVHELLYLISKIKVKDIMTRKPITVPADYTVEETADLLFSERITGVPVVDADGKVVGVITKTDLFKVILFMSGFGFRGMQFAFRVADKPGAIKELADIMRQYNGRMVSVFSTSGTTSEEFRDVYIRVYDIDRTRLDALHRDLREKATIRYIIDHKENKREIFE